MHICINLYTIISNSKEFPSLFFFKLFSTSIMYKFYRLCKCVEKYSIHDSSGKMTLNL